jgi:hypothetical protein
MEFKIGAGLACVGIAVGLGQWLIPPDRISYEVRFTFVAMALVFGLTGLAVLIHAAWRYLSPKHAELPPVDAFCFEYEFISMNDAAIRLYSEARIHKWPLADSAEVLGGKDLINWVAINLSMRVQEIWGKRPPSTLPECIPKEEYKRLDFRAGGTELWASFADSAKFIDLQVKTADLERVIAEFKELRGR